MKTEVTWGWKEPGGRKRSSRCGDASSKVQGMCVKVEMVIPVIPSSSSIHTNYHGQYQGLSENLEENAGKLPFSIFHPPANHI